MTKLATHFSKLQACGNDFVVMDDTARCWEGQESALGRALCDRHFGIGADGLMLVRQTADAQADVFELVFVNANGLIGEMCGNGARCVARFLRDDGLCVAQHWTLLTAAGAVAVEFLSEHDIRLALPSPLPWGPVRELHWGGRQWTLHSAYVGPPHVVCVWPDSNTLANVPIADVGPVVRHHEWYAPSGCNVNVVARLSQECLQLRTYERGVEAETLGCGTGATASVWLLHQQGLVSAQTTVITQSGERIHIDVSRSERPLLTGRAHAVAHGQLDQAWLIRHQLVPFLGS